MPRHAGSAPKVTSRVLTLTNSLLPALLECPAQRLMWVMMLSLDGLRTLRSHRDLNGSMSKSTLATCARLSSASLRDSTTVASVARQCVPNAQSISSRCQSSLTIAAYASVTLASNRVTLRSTLIKLISERMMKNGVLVD